MNSARANRISLASAEAIVTGAEMVWRCTASSLAGEVIVTNNLVCNALQLLQTNGSILLFVSSQSACYSFSSSLNLPLVKLSLQLQYFRHRLCDLHSRLVRDGKVDSMTWIREMMSYTQIATVKGFVSSFYGLDCIKLICDSNMPCWNMLHGP